MFETLVTGLLTNLLGSYIDPKCFSGDKINVAVWSGYVVLHALEIKPEVFSHPALSLVRGVCGSIEIKIPWNRLHTDSVVITIDDVYLMVRTEDDLIHVLMKEDEFTIKKLLLEELYAQAKRKQEEAVANTKENNGFAARLINKIIDNLELHFRRIHVRLEDRSSGDHPFSLGLTIESVHAQSTNSNWQPTYIDAAKTREPRIYKMIELNHFSAYLNPDCVLQKDYPLDFVHCELEDFSDSFNQSIPKRFDERNSKQIHGVNHHYLLKPVDASARLIVNRDPFDVSVPKFEVDVDIEEVALRLEESQYCDLLCLLATFQTPIHFRKYQKYRKYRPKEGIFDSKHGEWWRYAINCVLDDIRNKKMRWSWAYMKQRREDRKAYMVLWEEKCEGIIKNQMEDLSDEEHLEEENEYAARDYDGEKEEKKKSVDELDAKLELIERRRCIEDILFFRYLADSKIISDLEHKQKDATRSPQLAPLPPMSSSVFSDTESVDTDTNTESSAQTDQRYHTWGQWMFGWTSRFATSQTGTTANPRIAAIDSLSSSKRIIPEVELRQLFRILEYEPSKRAKKRQRERQKQHIQPKDSESFVNEEDDQFSLSGSRTFEKIEREEYIVSRIGFNLVKGSITLASDPHSKRKSKKNSIDEDDETQDDGEEYSSKYKPIDFLLGVFSQLQLAVISKDESMKLDLSLQSIEAFDKSAVESAFSRLISPKNPLISAGIHIPKPAAQAEGKFQGPVFLMSYETNPTHTLGADAVLYAHLEPLEMVFSPTAACWGRLGSFLNTPEVLGLWEEIEVASLNDIVNLKARTEAKLAYVMANRIALSVDLRIQAPVLVIPESDTDYQCARLVVDLGRIQFHTDRLSKLEADTLVLSTSNNNSLGTDNAPNSSMVLFHPGSPGMSSSAAFVRQLYDDAEKGEGAIRWKEEFYDKYSLSVSNIQVLLIPYGRRLRDHGDFTSMDSSVVADMALSSTRQTKLDVNTTSLQRDLELVEKFNFNMTIRMSVLPLDATLTRFYIHADLPALIFNLSLEKYNQLMSLIDKFATIEGTKMEGTDVNNEPWFGHLEPPGETWAELVGSIGMSMDESNILSRSFLSSDILKAFTLEEELQGDQIDLAVVQLQSGVANGYDGDGASSDGSDDTWFSIASENEGEVIDNANDETAESAEQFLSLDDLRPSSTSTSSSAFPIVDVDAEELRDTSKRRRCKKPARVRLYDYATHKHRRDILDRRLFVCSLTFPLISVHFKKPSMHGTGAATSYHFSPDEVVTTDGEDLDEEEDENVDRGMILLKVEGFRLRLAKKTLSTQMNMSFRSLELEDCVDSTGRNSEYLIFSSPSIKAPYCALAPPPVRRGSGMVRRSSSRRQSQISRKRSSRAPRERILSFRRNSAEGKKASTGIPVMQQPAPENLMELVFISLCDRTGEESSKEIDVAFGSIQFHFDQSYVCSLIELIEATQARSAKATEATLDSVGNEKSSSDKDPSYIPPLELTPSVNQEYFPSISLTDSVRADLEEARKNLFAQRKEVGHEEMSARSSHAEKRKHSPPIVHFRLKLHTLALCFRDRQHLLASIALVDCQLECTNNDPEAEEMGLNVITRIGDVKLYDLCSGQATTSSEENTQSFNGLMGETGIKQKKPEFVELFGLDYQAFNEKKKEELDRSILTVRSVFRSHGGVDLVECPSKVQISLQPVRLVVNWKFFDQAKTYITEGPLALHYFLQGEEAFDGDVDEVGSLVLSSSLRTNPGSMFSSSSARQRAWSSPELTPDMSPYPSSTKGDVSTPFYDALASKADSQSTTSFVRNLVDQQNSEESRDIKPIEVESTESAKWGQQTDPFAFLNDLDLEITLWNPTIVIPAVTNLGSKQLGLALDLGVITLSMTTQIFGNENTNTKKCSRGYSKCNNELWAGRRIALDVNGLHIWSLSDKSHALEETSLECILIIPLALEGDNSKVVASNSKIPCLDSTKIFGSKRRRKQLLSNDEVQIPNILCSAYISAIRFNLAEKYIFLALLLGKETILPIIEAIQSLNKASSQPKVDVVTQPVEQESKVPTGLETFDIKFKLSMEELKIVLMTSNSNSMEKMERWLRQRMEVNTKEKHQAPNQEENDSVDMEVHPSELFDSTIRWNEQFGDEHDTSVLAFIVNDVQVKMSTFQQRTETCLDNHPISETVNDAQASAGEFKWDVFVHEVQIRDCIVDQETELIEILSAVPVTSNVESSEEGAMSSPTRSKSSSYLEVPSNLFSDEDNIDMPELRHLRQTPQFHLHIEKRRHKYSLDVFTSSMRFILLPKTILRLEYMTMCLQMAIQRTLSDLSSKEIHVGAFLPPKINTEERDGDPINIRRTRRVESELRDSISYSSRFSLHSEDEDIQNGKIGTKTHFISRLTLDASESPSLTARSGRESFVDVHDGSFLGFQSPSVSLNGITSSTSTSKRKASYHSISKENPDANKSDKTSPQTETVVVSNSKTLAHWCLRFDLSDLQFWVLSSEKKIEPTGLVLSSRIKTIVDFNSTSEAGQVILEDSSYFDRNDLKMHPNLRIKAELSRISLSVSALLPSIKRRRPKLGAPHQTKNFPWVMVEPFTIRLSHTTSSCELSPEKKNVSDEIIMVKSSDVNKKPSTGMGVSHRENIKWSVELPSSASIESQIKSKKWELYEPSLKMEKLVARVSYRELPLLMKIVKQLGNMGDCQSQLQESYEHHMDSVYALQIQQSERNLLNGGHGSEQPPFVSDVKKLSSDESEILTKELDTVHIALRGLFESKGLDFCLINNMAGQESPVVGIQVNKVNMTVEHGSNNASALELEFACEAWYHNLRLVASEPLLEPYAVKVSCKREYIPKTPEHESVESTFMEEVDSVKEQNVEWSPWRVHITSRDFLQVNVTDALVTTLTAASRAWQWATSGENMSNPLTRDMTEYSTYWIRNETGLVLRYWGPHCRMSTLSPGTEEPLEFISKALGGTQSTEFLQQTGAHRSKSYNEEHTLREQTESDQMDSFLPFERGERQLFIAVEKSSQKQAASGTSQDVRLKWQSEVAIPVDQVDSRMYALVDADGMNLRRVDCVIDVVVEKGYKFFVVRSTLLLENKTGSDLQVEFNPAPTYDTILEFPSSTRSSSAQKETVESEKWKATVRKSEMIPIPLHLVSAGSGYLMVRPHAIQNGHNDSVQVLPRAYAWKCVPISLFDQVEEEDQESPRHERIRDVSSTEGVHMMRFRRLHTSRPVRPFMMSAQITTGPRADLFYRKLSFHPPLAIHNLTAGVLEFCLATPNEWVPPSDRPDSELTVEHHISADIPHRSHIITGTASRWEDSKQRLRERGGINVADSIIWHLSDWDTPLELRVRMKGFEWSDPFMVMRECHPHEEEASDDEISSRIEQIRMKDNVNDAFLSLSIEAKLTEGRCREIFIYVPYWIINLTGLKLEYEHDPERIGSEHSVLTMAGQKLLNREELAALEEKGDVKASRARNPHLVRDLHEERSNLLASRQSQRFSHNALNRNKSRLPVLSRGSSPLLRPSSSRQENADTPIRRHRPSILPNMPVAKGLLDILPQSLEDPKALAQLEVLHACYSNRHLEKGSIRLRVSASEETRSVGGSTADGFEFFSKGWQNASKGWSKSFSLDQSGSAGEIQATDGHLDRLFSLAYSISNAKGLYSRTKIILLTPRFVLINALSSPAVEICHVASKPTPTGSSLSSISSVGGEVFAGEPSSNLILQPGDHADFHWTVPGFSKRDVRKIRCRFADAGWSWSGAVPLLESGEFAVRMRHESTRENRLIRVVLKMDPFSSCLCVYFREDSSNAPPYRIENLSLETLRVHQHSVQISEILLPHHSLEYAWDEPTLEKSLVVDMLPSAAGDNSRPLRIGIFSLDNIQKHPDALGGTLGIEVCTDGPTRVLRFTDTRLQAGGVSGQPKQKVTSRKKKISRFGKVDMIPQPGFLERFVSTPSVRIVLQLQGIGISVIDPVPKELIYISLSGIYAEFLLSAAISEGEWSDHLDHSIGTADLGRSVSTSLEREHVGRTLACLVTLSDFQIDNQLQGTPFPVLLRFSAIPTPGNAASRMSTSSFPVLSLCLVKHNEYAGIDFIRYFSARALPIHLRIDGSLISHLAPLFAHGDEFGIITSTRHKFAIRRRRRRKKDAAPPSHLENNPENHSIPGLLDDFNGSMEKGAKVLEVVRKRSSHQQPNRLQHAGLLIVRKDKTTTLQRAKEASPTARQQRSSSSRYYEGSPNRIAGHHGKSTRRGRSKISSRTNEEEQKKLYFEEFYVDTITASVSFSAGAGADAMLEGGYDLTTSNASSTATVGPVRLILNAIGTSLTKIANAPFKLNPLEINHSFVQPDALAARLAAHYQREALRQAYVILGSVDVLGNPMIVWKNLKAGFQDFIFEPIYGVSQSPTAFMTGIGRGTLSLMRASVYTFFDFNTRILTASSLGLSEACTKLDEYTGYPATRNIYQGLFQGVSGIVVAPIHSFEMAGLRGVAPGFLAGLLGLFLKPLLGLSLATSLTAATLRDILDPNTKAFQMRTRPPRYIDHRTRKLKVYSYVESLGEELVLKIRGSKYRYDGYLGHVDLKQKCLLVTKKRVLYLDIKASQKYEVEWELLAEEIVLVQCDNINKHGIILYYMEREDPTRRQALKGFLLSKYEITLPENKILFVRAMLQQQEKTILTQIDIGKRTIQNTGTMGTNKKVQEDLMYQNSGANTTTTNTTMTGTTTTIRPPSMQNLLYDTTDVHQQQHLTMRQTVDSPWNTQYPIIRVVPSMKTFTPSNVPPTPTTTM